MLLDESVQGIHQNGSTGIQETGEGEVTAPLIVKSASACITEGKRGERGERGEPGTVCGK